ncbi:MAG TPA: hypothetical protein VEG34_16890 [Thermoanaerobaculia bacterium]|nr:hypothetical protein [Thermoanaerobaculia bacterium]
MSLIDEALKRARQEAARQDAAQRYAYPATPAQVPLRDRSRSSLLVGLVAGLLIGVVAIGGTLFVTKARPGGSERAAAEVPAAAPAAASAGAPIPVVEELEPAPAAPAGAVPELPSPTPEPVPVPAAPPVAAPRIEASRPVESRPIDIRREIQPRPAAPFEPGAEPRAAEPAAPVAPTVSTAPAVSAAPVPPLLYVPPATDSEAAPPPSHTGPGTAPAAGEPGLNGRTFVRELPVPGGGKLELRGIASGSQPAALINGRVLARGEVIEGFTVVGVESRRVELKGYGATVYLSLDQEQ